VQLDSLYGMYAMHRPMSARLAKYCVSTESYIFASLLGLPLAKP